MLPVTAPFCNCSSEAIGYGSSSVSALLIVEGRWAVPSQSAGLRLGPSYQKNSFCTAVACNCCD